MRAHGREAHERALRGKPLVSLQRRADTDAKLAGEFKQRMDGLEAIMIEHARALSGMTRTRTDGQLAMDQLAIAEWINGHRAELFDDPDAVEACEAFLAASHEILRWLAPKPTIN